jgi:hypothetical protein
MIFCDSECIHCKTDQLRETICCIEPELTSYNDERLICISFKKRDGEIQELYPGMNKTGLFPGQIGYKES